MAAAHLIRYYKTYEEQNMEKNLIDISMGKCISHILTSRDSSQDMQCGLGLNNLDSKMFNRRPQVYPKF